jgi:ligand-binding sensor domain-containing protein
MKLLLFIIFFFIESSIYSQSYTYTNYNTKDGLAGSTVYCAAQDKDGFIWFGTETGLSRFDGTNFFNYTLEQGLPDNEILKIFCDSKNRIWLSTFRSAICYIYKGKVHNQDNDSVLKKIHLHGVAWQVCENKKG